MRRRTLLLAAPALAAGGRSWSLPAAQLQFPRDHGAHPALRTDWW